MTDEWREDREKCGEPNATSGACKNPVTEDDGSCWIPSHGPGNEDKENPHGRPSKLNVEVQEAICNMLAQGHSAQASAVKGGINYDTFNRWRKRGERQADAGEHGIYREFYEATERARVEGMLRFEDIVIEETTPVDAQGRFGKAMEMLRKRYPDVWAGVDEDAIGGDLNVFLSDVFEDETEKEQTRPYAKTPDEAMTDSDK